MVNSPFFLVSLLAASASTQTAAASLFGDLQLLRHVANECRFGHTFSMLLLLNFMLWLISCYGCIEDPICSPDIPLLNQRSRRTVL